MGLLDFLHRMREKREKFRAFEEEKKIEQKWLDKQKSANERELERFMKEEREDSIKRELEEFRRARQKKAQYGNQIIKVKNMFANDKQRILNSPSMMDNDKNVLHGGQLFFHGK